MLRHHLVGILAALGLTVALGALTPVPALAKSLGPAAVATQAQTIQFTSTPPSGADWYTRQTSLGFEYLAKATASSGLPVAYSIAPASADVCEIVYQDHPSFGPGAAVHLRGAGTCTVQADQPGDDAFLPAPQVSQSFQVEKVQTWLSKVKARKGLPGYTPATFSATLETWERVSSFWYAVGPFRGQVVTFSVAGRAVCSATTSSSGVATCRSTLLRSDLTRLRFTATYTGTDDYQAATAPASFVG